MKQSLFFFLFLYSFLANCQQADKVKVEKPGTLSTLLTKAQQDTCKHLVVSGKINSADIKVLRKMAGADGFGNLQVLDLKDTKIIPCEEPYLIIRNAEEKVLPWIGVELGATNGIFGMRDTDGLGGPLVEVFNANIILPEGNNENLTVQEISESMSLWKMLTKQKIHIKGHTIEPSKDGHYTFSAFTHKKLFCKDMFYHCPNLRMVVIPTKGKIFDRVVVIGSPIRYMEVANEIKKK